MDDRVRRARETQREIGKILLNEWDPIGVAEIPEARDEYSGYVGAVYRLLSSGSTAIEIAGLLREIETDRMGLTARSLDALVPVAERILALDTSVPPPEARAR